MVLKKTKHGGNTGNTLRKSYLSQGKHRSTSFIQAVSESKSEIPFVRNTYGKKEWIKDNGLTFKTKNALNKDSSNVKYSLNKDKRWKLYDDVDNQIKQHKAKSENFDTSDYESVALVVKPGDWLTGRNSKNYMKSFSDSNNSNQELNGKSWKSQKNLNSSYDKTYIIEQPIPNSTFPYCNKICSQAGKWSVKGNNRRLFKEFVMPFDDDYEDYENENGSSEDIEYEDFFQSDEDMSYTPNNSFLLEEFLKTPSIQNTGLKRSKKYTKNYSNGSFFDNMEKNHLQFIDYPFEATFNETVSFAANVNENSIGQTIMVKVNKDDINPACLKEKYQSSYIEGKSYPRCFAIYDYQNSNISLLIEVLSECKNEVDLHIKIFSDDVIEHIQELDDYSLVNFNCMIEMICPILERTTNVSTNKSVKNPLTVLPFKQYLSTYEVKDLVMNNINSNNLSEVLVVEIIKEEEVKENTGESYSIICSVCLEEVDFSTFMLECKHSFCNQCWTRYIETKVYLGNVDITCLELECDTAVDFVTAMKFLSNKSFSIFHKLLFNSFILKNRSKCCPNLKCERVAIPSLKENQQSSSKIHCNIPIVNCTCKASWCFNCQLGEHWPVSCELRQQYEDQMTKEFNYFYMTKTGRFYETKIRGRRCPFCNVYVEKNGGCPQIVCICGKDFCWTCLQSYKSHNECIPVKNEIIRFSSMENYKEDASKKMKGFRNALKYKIAIDDLKSLRRRLKVSKIKKQLVIAVPERSQINVIDKAIGLLRECYKLMENLSLLFAQRRKNFHQVKSFFDFLYLYTNILHNEIEVKTLVSLNVNKVENYSNIIESLLEKLCNI